MLTVDTAASAGFDANRWQNVLDLAEKWCNQDELPAIALIAGRDGITTGVHGFGRHRPHGTSESLRDDAIFLVASITKPVVATATLLLLERGQLTLGDRVADYLPEFATKGKNGIAVRHLLTHTSGLPDMLPNNRELRESHAPPAAFVEGTYQADLDFPPGRGVQYQSMGFAILGALIGRVTGTSCSEFLKRELFDPLQMHETALGAPPEWFDGADSRADRIAEIRLPEEQVGTDWGWNSRYWRTLGAPWGGLLTTPFDLARFAQCLLNGGKAGSQQILSPASIGAATRNQIAFMRDVPEADRRCRPWGLGWRLNWPAHSANFGDLLGPSTYGHWGATGTVLWIDPASNAFAVILTTQPQEPRGSYLARLSSAVAAAIAPSFDNAKS